MTPITCEFSDNLATRRSRAPGQVLATNAIARSARKRTIASATHRASARAAAGRPLENQRSHRSRRSAAPARVRQQSCGPYRQRSLWRLLGVEGSSADVLDRNCLLTLIDRGEAAYQRCRRSAASSRRWRSESPPRVLLGAIRLCLRIRFTFTRPYLGTESSRSKAFAVCRYSGGSRRSTWIVWRPALRSRFNCALRLRTTLAR